MAFDDDGGGDEERPAFAGTPRGRQALCAALGTALLLLGSLRCGCARLPARPEPA